MGLGRGQVSANHRSSIADRCNSRNIDRNLHTGTAIHNMKTTARCKGDTTKQLGRYPANSRQAERPQGCEHYRGCAEGGARVRPRDVAARGLENSAGNRSARHFLKEHLGRKSCKQIVRQIVHVPGNHNRHDYTAGPVVCQLSVCPRINRLCTECAVAPSRISPCFC